MRDDVCTDLVRYANGLTFDSERRDHGFVFDKGTEKYVAAACTVAFYKIIAVVGKTHGARLDATKYFDI